jgi:hypothetical protein
MLVVLMSIDHCFDVAKRSAAVVRLSWSLP